MIFPVICLVYWEYFFNIVNQARALAQMESLGMEICIYIYVEVIIFVWWGTSFSFHDRKKLRSLTATITLFNIFSYIWYYKKNGLFHWNIQITYKFLSLYFDFSIINGAILNFVLCDFHALSFLSKSLQEKCKVGLSHVFVLLWFIGMHPT
jgi:hypothetical protein